MRNKRRIERLETLLGVTGEGAWHEGSATEPIDTSALTAEQLAELEALEARIPDRALAGPPSRASRASKWHRQQRPGEDPFHDLLTSELWRLYALLDHCRGGKGEAVLAEIEQQLEHSRARVHFTPDDVPPTEAGIAEAEATLDRIREHGLIDLQQHELARLRELAGFMGR